MSGAPQAGGAAGARSRDAYARARQVLPGGTTRVTVERDPVPRYVSHGAGAWLHDLDGRRYLDLNNNYTALIHGHAFAPVTEALQRQLRDGTAFANPTEHEIALAELLCGRVPGLDRLRFCNSGTEAVLFAVKAARAFTGRPAIAKVEGAYHGAYDWVEVSQASEPGTWGPAEAPSAVPYYRGMPEAVLGDVVTLRFNDAEGAARLIGAHADRLAAVVLDPMPSRAGLVAPEPDFLAAVEAAARRHGILLISDEVLNLRQGHGGAAARYGLQADLFALAKIIGGGLPIGAVGGRAEVMRVFDSSSGRPALPQGGTFAANPLSMVAGRAAMQALDQAALQRLEGLGDDLRRRLAAASMARQAPFTITGAASLFRIHPKRRPPREHRDAHCSPAEMAVLAELSRFCAGHGILLPRGTSGCLSTPMGPAEVDLVVQVFERFLEERADCYMELP
ncbi:aspartate aminotransferase family protein [Marinibaculum pumilum]|uniref:Aspartate aminotransferase family protein n=1 Tax=Marinibaculum pumilum TaxID=1766165 RepID=A0ABV7L576_9PROT